MSKNTGKSYEKLTQELYQLIVDLDTKGYKKIEVQHDVSIKGKSGLVHQVDVFWEFYLGSVRYATIIEVKDWKKKVEKKDLMSFTEKLKDIEGFPTGIYVSKNGFQSGALEWAKLHGVKLVSISESGTMNHIGLNFNIVTPKIDNFILEIDNAWLKEYMDKNNIRGEYQFGCATGDMILFDDENQATSLIEHIRNLQKPYLAKREPISMQHIDFVFDTNQYWDTGDDTIPRVRVKGFKFDLSVHLGTFAHEIHSKNVADYILHDISEGNTLKFNSVHGLIRKVND